MSFLYSLVVRHYSAEVTVLMRPMSAVLALILFVLPSIGVAQSADRRGIPMMSFDDTSCGAWVRSQRTPAGRQAYVFWFRGFVSGFNFGSRSYQVPLDAMPDQETLALFIDKYCRENPLLPFVSAAFKLVEEQRVKLDR